MNESLVNLYYITRRNSMIENMLFSLGTALPIFLVMCSGYFMRQKEIIDGDFVKKANHMVFYVALPIKLFCDVSGASFQEYFDIGFILFITVVTVGGAILSWILGNTIIQKPDQIGAFAQGAFRGNFLYIGFSLMENILGHIAIKGPLAVAIIVPVYNIMSVIILSYAGKDRTKKIHLKKTLSDIAKNPLIVAITAGIIMSLIPVQVPVVAERTMEYFAVIATPLALIAIGASFNISHTLENLPIALIASAIKLVALPLLSVMSALFFGYRGEDIILIYVLTGVPTATVSFIMAAAMNADKELASDIIMVSTLLSIVTMTSFVFAFRSTGII